MDEEHSEIVPASPLASYEAPRVTPIGNLRDILAGGSSLPCENNAPAPVSGGDQPGDQCGPE